MVSAPPHKLTPALAGSCGPTAVCAVTGKTPKQVHSAIIEAASEDDEKPAHLDNCSFRHQARATEILDCELFELDGSRVQARSIPSPSMLTSPRNCRLCAISFNKIRAKMSCCASLSEYGQVSTPPRTPPRFIPSLWIAAGILTTTLAAKS
jgi:hypothetical protein